MEVEKNKKGKETNQTEDIIKITSLKSGKEEKLEIINKESLKKVEEKVPEKGEETSQQDQYIYVYGITNGGKIDVDIKGLKNKPITTISFRGITILISSYPNLHPMVEESEAMLHAEILNKLAKKMTVIPMAFGTVFKDQEILETILTKSYPTINAALIVIKDKFELGIKVVKKEAEEVSEKVSKEILEELNKLSVKNVQGDKFSDRLLLNHSFLVERNNFDPFSEKIGELEGKYPDLKFLYTGPWPAYSFVNININAG